MRRSKSTKLSSKGRQPARPIKPNGGSLTEGRRVLRIEARAVQALIERLDDQFAKAVDLLLRCKGKVVVSGMGKSGLVGQKIAATMASTGTPAFFLHPAEGIHGDLGMLGRADVLIADFQQRGDAGNLAITALRRANGYSRRVDDGAHDVDAGQEQ